MRIKFIKTNGQLVYVAILLFIVKTFLSYTAYFKLNDTVSLAMNAVICLLFFVKIISDKYSVKTLLLYIAIGLLFLFTCYKMKNFQLLVTVLACLAIRKADFNRIIAFIFQWDLIAFFVMILTSIFLRLVKHTPMFLILSGTKRFNFGFVHPNLFSVVVFNLILMWLWLNYEKIKLRHTFVLFLIGFVAFLLSKTRTTFFITVFIIFAVYFISKKRKSKILSYIAATIFPVFSFLFFVLSKLYLKGYDFIYKIDEALTGRIRLSSYSYENAGITFFGNASLSQLKEIIKWDSVYRLNDFTYDSIYTEILMYIGVGTLILLTVSFFLLSRKKDNKINIFVIAWCLYGITEVHGTNFVLCFPILLIAFLLNHKVSASISLKTKKH